MMNENYYLQKIENIVSENLMSKLTLCHFKKDEYIVKQGQELKCLYLLVKGRVRVCKTTANGNTLLCNFTSALSVIGEVEFFLNREINCDVICNQDCILYTIDLLRDFQLVKEDPLLMNFLATSMADKLYKSNYNASLSNNYPVINRLAAYLISCNQAGIIQKNFMTVSKMIGCSYRQLQRVLQQLCQKQYLLKHENGSYQIINESALKQLGQEIYQL